MKSYLVASKKNHLLNYGGLPWDRDSSRGVLSNLSIVHYVQKGIKQILFQSDKNLALQVSETHY